MLDTMKGKALGAIVLGLTFGLVGCVKSTETSQKEKQETTQVQPQNQTKRISGKIINIDEDSFAIGSSFRQGANFEFEHMRIKASDDKIYRLLFPGPSNYQVGDEVDFQYKEQSKISFKDLFRNFKESQIYLLQEGYFDADGIIIR